MPLPTNRPFNEALALATTASIATTPVAGVAVAPASGYVDRVIVAANGAITAPVTVEVQINGGADITGGKLILPDQAAGGPGVELELVLIGAGVTDGVFVNEGDLIVFTPSGGVGAAVAGAFALVIRKAG